MKIAFRLQKARQSSIASVQLVFSEKMKTILILISSTNARSVQQERLDQLATITTSVVNVFQMKSAQQGRRLVRLA